MSADVDEPLTTNTHAPARFVRTLGDTPLTFAGPASRLRKIKFIALLVKCMFWSVDSVRV